MSLSPPHHSQVSGSRIHFENRASVTVIRLTDSSPGLDSSFLLAFPGFPSDIFEQELLLTVAGPLRLIPDSLLCFRICQKCEIVQKTTPTV